MGTGSDKGGGNVNNWKLTVETQLKQMPEKCYPGTAYHQHPRIQELVQFFRQLILYKDEDVVR